MLFGAPCPIERARAALVATIDVGAARNKQFHRRALSLARRHHQRRRPVRGRRVHFGTLGEKVAHDVIVPSRCRVHQRVQPC